MAASATDYFIKVRQNFSTTIGAGGVADGTVKTIPLTSVANLPTDTAIELVINRITSAGVVTNNSETVRGVISGSGCIDTVRGVEGTAQGWDAGTVVEYLVTADIQNRMVTGLLVEHGQDGTHSDTLVTSLKATGAEINTGTEDAKIVTPKAIKDAHMPYEGEATGAEINTGTNQTKYASPKAIADSNLTNFIRSIGNGKIIPSVSSNNLTVAIKSLNGDDPSATNPVYCRIGDAIHKITSALSVTVNAGTNWFNAGSAELATKEIDYFVYLGYNTTDGIVIGFSRIPYAQEYSEFSTTSTNEKYCAISTITHAASGDDYENIGRFAATLSAGAGYTWSVPTFTNINLIQYPIRTTRYLDCAPVLTTHTLTSITAKYCLDYRTVRIDYRWNMTVTGTPVAIIFSLPISGIVLTSYSNIGSGHTNDGEIGLACCFNNTAANSIYIPKVTGAAWTAGAHTINHFNGFYQLI